MSKLSQRSISILITVAAAVAVGIGTLPDAVASELRSDSPHMTIGPTMKLIAAPKPCLYEYGARCVTWVTTDYSCRNIFQITDNDFKLRACSIYADRGIVTVIP